MRSARKNALFSLIFWLVLSGLADAADVATAQLARVAFVGISLEESSSQSAQMSRQFASLLQAQLTAEASVEWIEREEIRKAETELKLASDGLVSPSASIRVGRWLKARILLQGHIALAEGGRRVLQIEALDLEHADLLAERTMVLPGTAAQPLSAVLPSLEVALTSAKDVLREAVAVQTKASRQVKVALLFFHKTNWGEGDNDLFHEEFVSALERAVAANGGIRLIRLLRPRRATDEADLITAGLVENDPQTWNKVADLYVWGTFTGERPWEEEGNFHRLGTELSVWDGTGDQVTMHGKVTELAGRKPHAENMARMVVEAVERRQRGVATQAARETIAASLLARAASIIETVPDHARLPVNPKSRARFGSLIQTLEAACFFDPQNRDARFTLLSHRWVNPWFANFSQDRVRSQTMLRDAWGAYCDRFGFQPANANRYYVLSAFRMLELAPASSFPNNPEEEAQGKFNETARQELVRRAIKAVQFGNLDDFLGNIFNAGLQVEPNAKFSQLRWDFLHAVWPSYVRAAHKNKSTHVDPQARTRIRMLYDYADKAGEEEALYAQLNALKPDPITNAVVITSSVPKQLSSNPVAWKPEAPIVLMRTPHLSFLPVVADGDRLEAAFPKEAKVSAVLVSAVQEDILWLITLGTTTARIKEVNTDLNRELAHLPIHQTRLWRFNTVTRQLEDLTSRVPALKPFTGLLRQGNALWLPTLGDGVWQLDTASLQARKFSEPEGLQQPNALALAIADNRLYLLPDMARLQWYEPAASKWQAYSEWDKHVRSRVGGRNSTARLAGHGTWLFFSEADVLLGNMRSDTWRSYKDAFFASTPLGAVSQSPYAVLPSYPTQVLCITPDPQGGFWVGSGSGLHYLDPSHGTVRNWHFPPGVDLKTHMPSSDYSFTFVVSLDSLFDTCSKARAKSQELTRQHGRPLNPVHPTTRLPGFVTASAIDQDFLWLACGRTEGDRLVNELVLLHRSSQRWIGRSQVPGVIKTMAVAGGKLWLGLAGSPQLLSVNRERWLQVPQSQWLGDEIPDREIEAMLVPFSPHELALYAFWSGDYARTAQMLRPPQDLEMSLTDLLIQGLCFDKLGLKQPEKAARSFQEIIKRAPNTTWAKEATRRLDEERVADGK